MKKLLSIFTALILIPQIALGAIEDNLASCWGLNETSGNASDSVGTNNLTNLNSTAYTAAKINNGADFEYASTQQLSITDASQTGLDFSTAMSASFWYKPESINSGTGINTLFSKIADNFSDYSYWLFFTSGGSMIFRISGDGTNNEDYSWPSITLTNGTWYHIVITWTGSGSSAIFYLNDVSQGAKTGAVTSLKNSAGPFKMGSASPTTNDYRLDGILDEFHIWSRAITSTEVSSLYNSGSGLACPGVATTPPSFGDFFLFD